MPRAQCGGLRDRRVHIVALCSRADSLCRCRPFLKAVRLVSVYAMLATVSRETHVYLVDRDRQAYDPYGLVKITSLIVLYMC